MNYARIVQKDNDYLRATLGDRYAIEKRETKNHIYLDDVNVGQFGYRGKYNVPRLSILLWDDYVDEALTLVEVLGIKDYNYMVYIINIPTEEQASRIKAQLMLGWCPKNGPHINTIYKVDHYDIHNCGIYPDAIYLHDLLFRGKAIHRLEMKESLSDVPDDIDVYAIVLWDSEPLLHNVFDRFKHVTHIYCTVPGVEYMKYDGDVSVLNAFDECRVQPLKRAY